jgi:hypothetical protein
VSPIEAIGLTLFILALFAGLFLIIFGLPGTVVILIAVISYALATGFNSIGFGTILILVLIALVAESLEFFLGMAGAQRLGASRASIIASVIGGIAGAAMMAPLLLGLGVIIGSFIGAFAGAFVVEYAAQRKLKPAARASYGALLGRLAGVVAKGFCAVTMIIIALMKIYS